MEAKTENLWEKLKNLCLTQAIDILGGEHCPNVACVEIAERLINIVATVDRRACQSKGLEEIEKLNQFFDLINRR